jgi:hypothetical protein
MSILRNATTSCNCQSWLEIESRPIVPFKGLGLLCWNKLMKLQTTTRPCGWVLCFLGYETGPRGYGTGWSRVRRGPSPAGQQGFLRSRLSRWHSSTTAEKQIPRRAHALLVMTTGDLRRKHRVDVQIRSGVGLDAGLNARSSWHLPLGDFSSAALARESCH